LSQGRRRLAIALAVGLVAGIGVFPRLTATAAPATKGSWGQTNKRLGPPARDRHAMAFDAARGEIVMFGGINSKGNTPGTWLFKNGSWREATPATSPALRTGAAMVYDSARQEIVMFGGHTSTGRVAETWTWDGSDWHLEAPATSPTGRSFPSLAYDSIRGEVVLFGGMLAVGGSAHDTWTWNGSDWTQEAPLLSPPTRDSASMTFDTARGETVLFGGYGAGGPVNDTWTWNGENWTAETPAASPPLRTSAGMTYDAARQEVVLLGGIDRSAHRNDIWVWNGQTWTERTPATRPPKRSSMGLAYDASAQRTILFGGSSANLDRADTWSWNGTDWSPLDETIPEARFDAEAVYDGARENIVMFGGDTDPGKVAETWIWDGGWQQSTSTGPSARSMFATVYDAKRQEVVLFGGMGPGAAELGDTWVWDGDSWAQRDVTIAPPPRHNHVMFYDSELEQTILWGGYNGDLGIVLDDTWAWNGTEWELLNPETKPAPRSGATAAYDPVRKQGVLFGGYATSDTGLQYTNNTWIWDGETWTERFLAQPPPGRSAAAMTYDATARRVLLFGGNEGLGEHLNDLWAWTGSEWFPVAGEGPGPRWGAAMAHHTELGKSVVFGGNNNNFLDDTWEFSAASQPTPPPVASPRELWTRPGVRSLADVAAANLDGDPGRELILGGQGVAAFDESGLIDRRYEWVNKWPDGDDPMRGGDNENVFEMETTDANEDGVPDAIVAGSEGLFAFDGKTGDVLWDIRTEQGIPWVYALASADFNDDGVKDIVYSGYSDQQVIAVDGTSGEPLWRGPRSSGFTQQMGTDDFNGDGVTDAISVGHSPAGPSVHVFSGVGAVETGVATPLWTANSGTGDPTVFAAGQVVAGGAKEVVVGDYHGDVDVYDGATGAPIGSWTVEGRVGDIAVIDADGGDDLEIAVASGYNDDNGDSRALGVYQPDGTPAWELDTPAPPLALDVLDVDNDGVQDLVYAGGWWEFRGVDPEDGIVGALDPRISALEAGAPKVIWEKRMPTVVELVEHGEVFGHQSLLIGERTEGWIRALNYDGTERWVHRTGSGIRAIATGDVDGDGRADVVEGDDAGGVAVHKSGGDTLWERRIHRTASPDIASVGAGDIAGDKRAEVFAGTFEYTRDQAGYIHAYSPDGDTLWVDRLSGSAGDIIVRDLDGTGSKDILAGATGKGLSGSGAELTRYDSAGNAVWRAATPPSTFGMLVETTRLNGDAIEDVVVGTLPFGTAFIVGFDGATGAELWRYQTPAHLQWMDVRPGSDGIAAGDTSGRVYKVSTAGEQMWEAELGTPSRNGTWTPDADGDGLEDIATSTDSGSVFMLNSVDGSILWDATVDGDEEWAFPLELIEGKDHSFLATGTFSAGLGMRGKVYFFDPQTGARTGTIPTQTHVYWIEGGDLNGDGNEEAIAAAGTILHAIDLFGPLDPDPSPSPSPTPSPSPSPGGKHTAQGNIAGSNPASGDTVGLTEAEFLASCAIPQSQGLDGFVFEVPEAFRDGKSTVSVKGLSAGPYDLDARFYKADCTDAGGGLLTNNVDESGPLPAGAAFVMVNQFLGVDTDVTLTITKPGTGDPDPDPEPGASAVTMRASRSIVGFRRTATLGGMATGTDDCEVAEVALERRFKGSTSWAPIGEVPVQGDGIWSTAVAPKHNAFYRARVGATETCLASQTPEIKVDVRADVIVKPARCSTTVIKGYVVPIQPGTRTLLQRKVRGRWKTIARDTLDKGSRFVFRKQSCKGKMRILWPTQGNKNIEASQAL
jgi:PQQ-like domain